MGSLSQSNVFGPPTAEPEQPPDSLVAGVTAAMAPGSSPGTRRIQELLAAAVDHVRDAVCLTTGDLDHGPCIIHVNPAFTALTGYAREEIVGQTPYILHGPATEQAPLERLMEGMRGGRPVTAEVTNYTRGGREFIMRVSVVPIRGRSGEVTHFLGLLRDATSEHTALASSQMTEAMLQQTTDAVITVDARGRVIYANPAALALTRRTALELIGLRVRDTGLTPRKLRVYREIITTLQVHPEWRGEYESSARDGDSRRLAVSVTRVNTGDFSTRYVIDVRDVTRERHLEQIAEATNLVENMGYVFASLRHELGNPINSIKTALTVLRQNVRTLPRERVEDYLDRVLSETARVEYLLRSLQSFNTTSRPTLEPLPVGPFLERFANMVRHDAIKRGVALTLAVDDEVGAAIADPRALHQVMLNLLTNAFDAVEGRPSPRIRLAARRGSSRVRIMVSDNGAGIPARVRERLFQPFQTTKPKGNGIGLAITRKLVTLMHGTITLDASTGWETTFVITLDGDIPDGERRTPTLWPPSNRFGR